MDTEAVDDYLKAIYELAGEDGRATTAGIAKKLSVAPASVTGMLRKLAERKPPWVRYQKHHGAQLADPGRRRALEIIRHHRLSSWANLSSITSLMVMPGWLENYVEVSFEGARDDCFFTTKFQC